MGATHGHGVVDRLRRSSQSFRCRRSTREIAQGQLRPEAIVERHDLADPRSHLWIGRQRRLTHQRPDVVAPRQRRQGQLLGEKSPSAVDVRRRGRLDHRQHLSARAIQTNASYRALLGRVLGVAHATVHSGPVPGFAPGPNPPFELLAGHRRGFATQPRQMRGRGVHSGRELRKASRGLTLALVDLVGSGPLAPRKHGPRNDHRRHGSPPNPPTTTAYAFDRANQRAHGRVPLGRVGPKPAPQDHPVRRVGIAAGRRGPKLTLADRVAQRGGWRAGERLLAVEQLVDRDAIRKLVERRAHLAAVEVLRGNVAGSSHQKALGRQGHVHVVVRLVALGPPNRILRPRLDGARDVQRRTGQPEVDDLWHAIFGHQQVVGFDVAMNKAGLVRRREAVADGQHRVDDLLGTRGRTLEPLPDRSAGDEFHRDEHTPAEQPAVVHGDEVRMRQASGGSCLAEHSGRVLGSGLRGAPLENLDGDPSTQPGVHRGVHHAHSAPADLSVQHEPPDVGAGRELRRALRGVEGENGPGRIQRPRRIGVAASRGLLCAHDSARSTVAAAC